MNCPACNVQLLMMERLGTQIDYCPQCRGIWLEKGKLDKLIERSSAEMPARAISEGYENHPLRHDHEQGHRDRHHDDNYDGHRKRRGFLHDLFD